MGDHVKGLGIKSAYVSKEMMERAFLKMHAERKLWRREVYFMRAVVVAMWVGAAVYRWWPR